jgi:hypothetical protein
MLEQAEALAGHVAADAMTRTDAVAMLRERHDLTDFGAGDVLDNWSRYSRGEYETRWGRWGWR